MKVCLIGNNLTSLILASILSKKNFNIEIYSKRDKKYKFKTRTVGITNHNLNYLSNYFKNIVKITKPINEIKILIKNKKINEKILFKKNSKSLFHMIKYEKLFLYVKSKVISRKNIFFKYYKKDFELNRLVRNKKFTLIINCENSNILTAKYLKNAVFKNYKNKAFTTIIKHSKLKNNSATQIFTSDGPLAFLPLSETSTSVVYSLEMNEKKNITEKDVLKKIKNFNSIYKKISFNKFENFYLNFVLPKRYHTKEILFLGDSIHIIHPLAGQGLNMTIRDLIKFDEILEDKLNLGIEIDKSIYKEFESKTKSLNFLFSSGIDFIYEFFRFNKNFVPATISKKLFSFINKNSELKDLYIKYANSGNL